MVLRSSGGGAGAAVRSTSRCGTATPKDGAFEDLSAEDFEADYHVSRSPDALRRSICERPLGQEPPSRLDYAACPLRCDDALGPPPVRWYLK